jgi:hypothetical protein
MWPLDARSTAHGGCLHVDAKSMGLPLLREGEDSVLTVVGLTERTTTRAGAAGRRATQGPGEGDLVSPGMAAPARGRGIANTRSDEASRPTMEAGGSLPRGGRR